MINLDDYPLFCIKASLKNLSLDDSDPNDIQYMTESELQAVDFDKVKEEYERSLGLVSDHADSVDAIMCTPESIVFIEFKNGKMKSERAKVKTKMRDSLLIFGGITGKTITYTRQHVDYILVYNESKNPLPNQLTRDVEQDSPSKRFIAKHLAQKGKQEFILYDLERFKQLYFREVHTYTQHEFETFLAKNAIS